MTRRFGYHLLLERLLSYRAAAQGDGAGAAPQEAAAADAMDRRRVLGRLAAELDCGTELLLARGFDKAYRRAVEGL